jgi:sigma-B regulation protein RsbU (phosphoserine phosphatase)
MNEALESVPAGIFSFDDNGIILEANRILEEMLGCDPGVLKGSRLHHILAPAERIYYQTHFFPALKLRGKLEKRKQG